MLIGVSGIGPKVAISILSALTPEQFAAAVCSSDAKTLARAKGLGQKGAERIILELREETDQGIRSDRSDVNSGWHTNKRSVVRRV